MAFLGLGLKRAVSGSYQRLGDPPARDIFLKGLDLPSAEASNNRLTSPYSQHSTVFSCVRALYTTFIQAPYKLYRGDTEVVSAPILKLLARPAPFLSGKELWQFTVMFLELAGNALWWLDNDGQRDRIPRNILVFNPRHFTVVKDRRTNMLVGYKFNPGTSREPIFLTTDEIVHFRYPNPDDPWWGVGPLQVARVSAEQDYKAALYNSAFFENSAEPSALLIYKGESKLTDDQKQQIVAGWHEQHQSVNRAFKVGVLPGEEWDYKQLGLSQKDMQFLQQRQFHSRDIAKIFNVPPLFLGDYEKTGLSDAGVRTQYRLLWDTNLIPKGNLIEDKVNAEFLSRYEDGLTGEFDTDEIPALKEDFSAKLANAKVLFDMWVPFNQINEKLDLGFDPTPWGDDAYVPPTLAPISQLSAGGSAIEPERIYLPSPRLLTDRNERVLQNFWRSFVSTFAPLENRYASRLRRFFFDLRSQSLGALAHVYGERAFGTGDIARVLFWYDQAKATIRALSAPFFSQAFHLGGLSILGEIGREDSVFLESDLAKRFLQSKDIRVVGIVDTVRDHLRQELLEGFEANESLGQVADRVRATFNAAANRARTIARTEVGSAISGGRHEGMVQQRVKRHAWLSARDVHVREQHAPGTGVDGEVVAVGEKFSNGLRFPLDLDGEASQVINCRCVTISDTR